MSVDPFEPGRLERRIMATAEKIYGLVPIEHVELARNEAGFWKAIAIIELGVLIIAIGVGVMI